MNVLELFTPIRTFVFDVDGVLTDGSLLILDDGQMARKMNVKDGYALQLAIKKGYRVVVISGAISLPVKERLEKLGVTDIFMEVTDKKAKLINYADQHGLEWERVLFMGDDIPDHEAMKLVGLPACPSDAVMEIKEIAQYISHLPGGSGCARDVIEKVLKLNGHWEINTTISSK